MAIKKPGQKVTSEWRALFSSYGISMESIYKNISQFLDYDEFCINEGIQCTQKELRKVKQL